MQIQERRIAPRFEVSLSAEVHTQSDFQAEVEVTNISQSGLQFSIPHTQMPHLIPFTMAPNQMSPIGIRLMIYLPRNQEPLEIVCGIVYVKRQSMDRCYVGCRFEAFVGQAAKRFESFISQLGGRDEAKAVSPKRFS